MIKGILKGFISGAFWSVVGNLFSKGALFAASIYFARILGPEHYGYLGAVRNLVNFLSVFAALGLEGLSKILWTAGDKVFFAMLIALIWIQVGFMVVLLLAGADKIPFEFYEAAKI